jgi:hypothetical protein
MASADPVPPSTPPMASGDIRTMVPAGRRHEPQSDLGATRGVWTGVLISSVLWGLLAVAFAWLVFR